MSVSLTGLNPFNAISIDAFGFAWTTVFLMFSPQPAMFSAPITTSHLKIRTDTITLNSLRLRNHLNPSINHRLVELNQLIHRTFAAPRSLHDHLSGLLTCAANGEMKSITLKKQATTDDARNYRTHMMIMMTLGFRLYRTKNPYLEIAIWLDRNTNIVFSRKFAVHR